MGVSRSEDARHRTTLPQPFFPAGGSRPPSILALTLVVFLLALMITKWPEPSTGGQASQAEHREQGEPNASAQGDSEGQVEHQAPAQEMQDKEDKTTNVLLIGYDSREDRYLSDVLMVAQLEEGSRRLKLLSIPRDLYVRIPNARDPYQKINAAYAIGGPELAVETVEGLTSIPIDHYAAVDFKGFTKAIDAVGGVPIKVEKSYYEQGYTNIDLEPGRQTLSGEQALAYVRFRHNSRGDFGRIERQQKLLSALIDKVVSVEGIRGLPGLVNVASKYVGTDLRRARMLALCWEFREIRTDGDVKSATLKGTPTSLEDEGSVLIPKAQKNKEVLSSFKE